MVQLDNHRQNLQALKHIVNEKEIDKKMYSKRVSLDQIVTKKSHQLSSFVKRKKPKPKARWGMYTLSPSLHHMRKPRENTKPRQIKR